MARACTQTAAEGAALEFHRFEHGVQVLAKLRSYVIAVDRFDSSYLGVGIVWIGP
jgi:hypothetical protein